MPSATSKRFELPLLDFKFGSLTDGTNIPAPLPSPIEEEPAPAKKDAAVANGADKPSTAATTAASSSSPQSQVAKAGTKRPAEDTPISPVSATASTARPGSIRRLFSRNLLNASYEADGVSIDGSTRPPSRSTTLDEKRSKRSSGWFRRLRGADSSDGGGSNGVANKRASVQFGTDITNSTSSSKSQAPQQPAGPPPPMIPELRDLEAKVDLKDGSSFGADLFKNIR